RKSGRVTEGSVLRLWKQWANQALTEGIISDAIIDSNHLIAYLKYAATCKLLTSQGCEREGNQRLSALDPHSAEDFDVMSNTILDSQILPHHFEEVKKSIFMGLNQLPSIIKAHFSWTWQCTMLNRGDELINLLICCIQPHQIYISDYTTADGRRSGLGRFEPDYNFVLPHRDPLHCSIGALAILLHYIFDREKILEQVGGWNWSRASTWQKVQSYLSFQVPLLFGRKVGELCSADAMQKMYKMFLLPTSIKSAKKMHLARRTLPGIMEDMGVNMDEIDGVGHWTGNTRREAVTALAGFYVGEQYDVPWVTVDVPQDLQSQIFPFVEEALISMDAHEKINHGTVNFLELLQQLRPFFWRAMGAIHEAFPESVLFKRMEVLQSEQARHFLTSWPAACQVKDAGAQDAMDTAVTFSESAMQSVFMSISISSRQIESALREHSQQLGIIA
ncbi:uncharacterized protein LAESUDRAFT_667384, partial [Laetiporus sulphureus 93-53]